MLLSTADRKEAWSADTYTRHTWQFNQRNTRLVELQRGGEGSHNAPLSVIYTQDIAKAKQQGQVVVEDVDGTEYRVSNVLRNLINNSICTIHTNTQLWL